MPLYIFLDNIMHGRVRRRSSTNVGGEIDSRILSNIRDIIFRIARGKYSLHFRDVAPKSRLVRKG